MAGGATAGLALCAALAEPAAKRLAVSMIAIIASTATVARLLFRIMNFPSPVDRIMDSDLIAKANVKAGDGMDSCKAAAQGLRRSHGTL
jgi:hypothetical protein